MKNWAKIVQCELGFSEQVGGLNIKSASRMNKAVVIFLSDVQMIDNLIEHGITINDTFLPLLPLSNPSKKKVGLQIFLHSLRTKLFRECLKDMAN